MKCSTCSKPLNGKQIKWCGIKCKNQDSNIKYQSYQLQKKRALDRKIKIVNMSGGCCSKCGYKKNLAALEFHHINPSEKKFKLDSRKLSNSNWNTILSELSKCELLCSNCHAEEHFPDLEGWAKWDLNPQSRPL